MASKVSSAKRKKVVERSVLTRFGILDADMIEGLDMNELWTLYCIFNGATHQLKRVMTRQGLIKTGKRT